MSRRPILSVALLLALAGCSDDDDTKTAVGGSCAASTDCAEAICHAGICVAASPLDNGVACQGDAWCKSLGCKGGTCAQNDRANGKACLHAEECAAGNCRAGFCAAPNPDAAVKPDVAAAAPDSGPVPDTTPAGDQGPTVTNSGKICPPACPGAEACVMLSTSTQKGMCLATCDGTSTCPVPDPSTQLSECSKDLGLPAPYTCLWICEKATTSYKCPDSTSYDCKELVAGSGVKLCVPK